MSESSESWGTLDGEILQRLPFIVRSKTIYSRPNNAPLREAQPIVTFAVRETKWWQFEFAAQDSGGAFGFSISPGGNSRLASSFTGEVHDASGVLAGIVCERPVPETARAEFLSITSPANTFSICAYKSLPIAESDVVFEDAHFGALAEISRRPSLKFWDFADIGLAPCVRGKFGPGVKAAQFNSALTRSFLAGLCLYFHLFESSWNTEIASG